MIDDGAFLLSKSDNSRHDITRRQLTCAHISSSFSPFPSRQMLLDWAVGPCATPDAAKCPSTFFLIVEGQATGATPGIGPAGARLAGGSLLTLTCRVVYFTRSKWARAKSAVHLGYRAVPERLHSVRG